MASPDPKTGYTTTRPGRQAVTPARPPALRQAGWDELSQLREEVSFTKGRIIVRGKMVTRGKAKRADYILYYKPNIPLAVIEAKDNNCHTGDGLQQALEYAEMLQIPFVFSSNGDGFVSHDRTFTSGEIERTLSLEAFPSPDELWKRYREWKALQASADDGRLAEYFTGTGIKHFTGMSVDSYRFPLPPLAEQRRIVTKVDELMAVCDQLEAQLDTAKTERQRLLESLLFSTLHGDPQNVVANA